MPLRDLSIASRTVVLSSLGALLCSLDSAFNVAFPAVSRWFGISPNGITLLVILYHIPLAALTIGGGMLGDRFGHRRLFATGLWISAIAFPLCGLAPTYSFLVGARVLQGIGGGFVFGTSPALITLAVPARDAGLGLGVLNFAAGLGLAGAPLLAGVLIDLFGWPSVFLFRIPLAAALALSALPWVRGHGRMLETQAGIYAVAPVPPRALISNALALLANAAFFVIYMLGPYYLVHVLGYSATLSGFVFMLVPLSTALAAPISGSLSRVTEAKNIVAAGLALEVVGLALVALLGDRSSLASTALAFAAAGFGIGAFQVPNMAIVMAALPGQLQGFAGGMISTMRTLGIIAAAALGPWLFETRQRAHLAGAAPGPRPFVRAFNETFAACAALAAVAFLLSLALRARPRAE
jgi:MFS family permease